MKIVAVTAFAQWHMFVGGRFGTTIAVYRPVAQTAPAATALKAKAYVTEGCRRCADQGSGAVQHATAVRRVSHSRGRRSTRQ